MSYVHKLTFVWRKKKKTDKRRYDHHIHVKFCVLNGRINDENTAGISLH